MTPSRTPSAWARTTAFSRKAGADGSGWTVDKYSKVVPSALSDPLWRVDYPVM